MRNLYSTWKRRQAPQAVFDLSSGGTFARALAAYRRTGALTGSSGLDLVASGARRIEYGSDLLMEGARTNMLWNSRALGSAGWSAASGPSFQVADYAAGPDGSVLADRFNPGGAWYSSGQTVTALAGAYVASAYGRATSGTTRYCATFAYATLGAPAWALTIGTDYARQSRRVVVAAGNHSYYATDNTVDGNTARDLIVDLHQVEAGYFASSPIVTASGTVTRPADTLIYVSGDYPDELLTEGLSFTFAPMCSSADFVAGNLEWWLCEAGGGNDCYLAMVKNGADVAVQLFSGSIVAEVSAISFSAEQELTFTVDHAAGALTVSGATTGDDTATGFPTDWSAAIGDSFSIGGKNNDGTMRVFGRYVDAEIGLL